uniref:Cation efflux protein transmembrane domain-containing protein n=1 Tax=Alexandrium monilatum TaxID=311494 RepID=A0A7S4R703_9DINO
MAQATSGVIFLWPFCVPASMARGGSGPFDGQALLSGVQAPQLTVEFKWLALLFLETLFLLVFQVTAGLLAGSLALLADSGHSCADVVGYAINLFVERQKNVVGGQYDAALIDLLGSGLSTVLLCVATWSASIEAIERLRTGLSPESQAGSSSALGPALLSFAVVSTGANIGTLALYQLWRAPGSRPKPDMESEPMLLLPPSPSPAVPPLPPAPAAPDPRGVELQDLGPPGLEPPGIPGGVPVAPAPQRSRSRGLPNGRSRNKFCSTFAGSPTGDSSPRSPGSRSCRTGCQDAKCGAHPSSPTDCGGCGSDESSWTALLHRVVHPGCAGSHSRASPQGSGATAACSGCGNDNASWSALLHRVVHPGCSGSHGSHQAGDAADVGEGALAAGNLNFSSAMLHLMADVLRGIAILVVAVAIEVGCVPDPGKADAICALAVAVFVTLGSVEILRRLGVSLMLKQCWRPAEEEMLLEGL